MKASAFEKATMMEAGDSSDEEGGLDSSQILNSSMTEHGHEKKKRKKTSEVWQYFTLEQNSDGKEQFAACKYCGHRIKYVSQNGTGGLRAHAIRCNAIRDLSGGVEDVPSDIIEESKKLHSLASSTKKRQRSSIGGSEAKSNISFVDEKPYGAVSSLPFSKLKPAVTELVLLEGLPFGFGQSAGFKQFLKSLYGSAVLNGVAGAANAVEGDHPLLPTAEQIESEVNLTYSNLLMRLHNFVDTILATNTRVSLVVNLYQTNRHHRVLAIGIQYVNEDWELTHFLLNVLGVMMDGTGVDESQQKKARGNSNNTAFSGKVISPDEIAKEIFQCLEEYRLTSHVFYGVFDHDCIQLQIDQAFWKLMQKVRNDSNSFSSIRPISLFESPELLSSNKTYPAILSQVVQQLLDVMKPTVDVIRRTLQAAKASLDTREAIDHPMTDSRSTMEMIHHFVQQKSMYSTHPSCTFSTSDWKVVEAFDKLLMSICCSIDGLLKVAPISTYHRSKSVVTAHLLFSNICDVNVELESFMKVYSSSMKVGEGSTAAATLAATPQSAEMISLMDKTMKFFRNSVDPILPALSIGLILDPSCKVEFIAETLDTGKAEKYANYMSERFKVDYQANASSHTSSELSAAIGMAGATGTTSKGDWGHDSRESFLKRRKFTHAMAVNNNDSSTANAASVSISSDLESYLKEPLQMVHSAAILNWWKLNASRFPALAAMAKDFLGCPVSAMSSGTVYSLEAASLPEAVGNLPFNLMRRTLLCKDWTRSLSNNHN